MKQSPRHRRPRYRRSLRWVLVSSCVVQIAAAAGVMAFLAYQTRQQTADNLAQELMSQSSHQIEQQLQSYTSLPHRVVQLVADDIELSYIDPYARNLQALDAYFLQRMQAFPSVSFISIGSETGQFIGAGTLDDASSRSSFVEVADETTQGRYLSYVMKTGDRLRQVHSTPHYDPRTRLWYQTAISQGRATWSPIYPMQDGVSAGLTITAVKPFRDPKGQLAGVAAVDLHLDDIGSFLRQINAVGQVFILEPSGLLVASSGDRHPYQRQAGQVQRIPATMSANPLIQATAQRLAESCSGCQLTAPQQFNFVLNGKKHFVQVMPWQDNLGLDWVIVTVAPESSFTLQADHSAQVMLVLWGLALLGAVGSGLWIARWLTQPLLRLNEAAEGIAKGDFNRTVEIHHTHEVEELAQSFNDMAHQLKTFFDAFEQSETKFAKFMESLPIGVSAINAAGSLVYVNLAGSRLLGQPSNSEILQQNPLGDRVYVAGTDQPYPRDTLPYRRALQGQSAMVDDIEIHRSDRTVQMEVQSIPVFDEMGRVLYVINVFQDISRRRQAEQILADYNWTLATQVTARTAELAQANVALEQEIAERKRTETALQLSEAKLNDVLKSAKAAIAAYQVYPDQESLDQCHLFDYRSPGHVAVFGYTPEELEADAQLWSSRVHPEDLLQVVRPARYQVLQQTSLAIEYRFMHKDGTLRWISDTLMSRWEERSACWIVTAVATDITDLKQAEAALEMQRAFLDQIINAVPNVLFVKDRQGRFLAINQSGAALYSKTVEAILGQRDIDLGSVSSAQFEEFMAINREVMDTLQPRRIIAQAIKNLQGELRWYQTVISPFLDSAGQVQGIIGASTDITDMKRVEEELRQAKNLAEAASKAKSAFLANMSHELRTPLNAILGFSQLMARDMLTPQQQKQLETINRNGEYLLQLINDVLSIAKIESGRITLEESQCDLYTLLENVKGMFSLRAQTKGLQLLCEYDARVPQWILVDGRKLRQILTNLIDNAIKFTEQGEVQLQVKLTHAIGINEPRSQDHRDARSPRASYPVELMFTVTDTGLGIAPEELDLIFESFMQSEVGRRSQQGTGLGLPICRRFVQLMGGKLTVRSQFDRGSTFQFSIPLKIADPFASINGNLLQASDSDLQQGREAVNSALQSKDNSPESDGFSAVLQPSALRVMPDSWIAQLNFAARSADAKIIAHLLEQIPEVHQPLKQAIAHLVHHFQLEQLIQLTELD